MAPDLNSLPPSRSNSSSFTMQQRAMHSVTSGSNQRQTPSPRQSSGSLAATATLNAAESRRSSLGGGGGSPTLGRTPSDRRRSQVATSSNSNDPTISGLGELASPTRRGSGGHSFSAASPLSIGGRNTIATGDPHHQRQPSLGDIHNELEQEQEAQVNRMLQLIRAQQQQLDTMRAQHSNGQVSAQTESATIMSVTGTAVFDELTPQSEHSPSFPSIHPAVGAIPRPSGRTSQESPNASRSPALRPLPSQEMHVSRAEWWPPSPADSARRNSSSRRNSTSLRDESAYYQAETANLQRENQMLRQRIRELEKHLSEQNSDPNTPAIHSSLATSVLPTE